MAKEENNTTNQQADAPAVRIEVNGPLETALASQKTRGVSCLEKVIAVLGVFIAGAQVLLMWRQTGIMNEQTEITRRQLAMAEVEQRPRIKVDVEPGDFSVMAPPAAENGPSITFSHTSRRRMSARPQHSMCYLILEDSYRQLRMAIF